MFVTVHSSGPTPAPQQGWVLGNDWPGGPGAQVAPAETLPPSWLSEHKTQPLPPVLPHVCYPGPTPTLCARQS